MNESATGAALFIALLGASYAGFALRSRLSERHRSRETTEALNLIATMIVTFAALVLGLLTSSVKTTFDSDNSELRGFCVQLIQLDQRLREYGEGADPARALLRSYTAASIASIWPDEPPPPGDYYARGLKRAPDSLVTDKLAPELERLDLMIRLLDPKDTFHREIAASARARIGDVLQARWHLVESVQSSISWPFLAVLVLWLGIAFTTFGLVSPRNSLVSTVLVLSAFSVASVVYVILDLDTPLTGFVQLSSQPMRDALNRMNLPPLPVMAPAAAQAEIPVQ